MDIKPEQWINAREAFMQRSRPVTPPRIDEEVSKVIGKPIYANDPRLIKAVAELKQMNKKSDDPRSASQDNYLKDPSAIDYLKKKLA